MSQAKRKSRSYRFGNFSAQSPEQADRQPKEIRRQRTVISMNFNPKEGPSEEGVKTTPIAALNSDSPPAAPTEPQLKVISQLQTVQEDQPEPKLENQTIDTLQRNSLRVEEAQRSGEKENIEQNISQNEIILKKILSLNQDQEDFLKHTEQMVPSKMKQKWFGFFEFRDLLKPREERLEHQRVQSLKRWVLESIVGQRNKGKQLSFSGNSEVLDYYLSGNADQLIGKLLSESNYSKALGVSNLADRTTWQHLGNKEFGLKKEFNLIHSGTLTILKRSCWLFELGLLYSFFCQEQAEHKKQIFGRYYALKPQIMPCQLLLLGLSCDPREDKEIAQQINSMLSDFTTSSFLQKILCWIALRNWRDVFPSLFAQMQDQLLSLIQDPLLFEQMVCFSEDAAEVTKHLAFFLQHNSALAQEQTRGELRKTLSKEGSAWQPWTVGEDLKELLRKGRERQFLELFITRFSLLEESNLIDFSKLIASVTDVVVCFKMLCSYKNSDRKQNYNLLDRLQKVLSTKDSSKVPNLSRLIEGSKALLEIKLGASVINDLDKLKSLADLCSHLNQLVSTPQNAWIKAEKVKKYMATAVTKVLESRNGIILLQRACRAQKVIPQECQAAIDIIKTIQTALGQTKELEQKMKIRTQF